MNTWRLMATHNRTMYEETIQWSHTHGAIAIGWDAVGDLTLCSLRNEQHLTTLVERAHRPWNLSTSSTVNGGRSLWRLYHDVKIGDLVILNTNRRELVMRVLGEYYYEQDSFSRNNYCHRRKAEAIPVDPDWLWRLSGGMAPGENVRRTLFRCQNTVDEAEVKSHLN